MVRNGEIFTCDRAPQKSCDAAVEQRQQWWYQHQQLIGRLLRHSLKWLHSLSSHSQSLHYFTQHNWNIHYSQWWEIYQQGPRDTTDPLVYDRCGQCPRN